MGSDSGGVTLDELTKIVKTMARFRSIRLAGQRMHQYLRSKLDIGVLEGLWQYAPTLTTADQCEWQFLTSTQYFREILSPEIAQICYTINHTPLLDREDDYENGPRGKSTWRLTTYPRDEKLPRLVEAHIPMMVEYLTKAYLCGGKWKPPEEG